MPSVTRVGLEVAHGDDGNVGEELGCQLSRRKNTEKNMISPLRVKICKIL